MSFIKVYSLDSCEHSNHLKETLWMKNISFEEVYLGSTKAINDLRSKGIFCVSAPVLQVQERYYNGADLFPDGIIDWNFMEKCLDPGYSS
jgi:glutaredoxin